VSGVSFKYVSEKEAVSLLKIGNGNETL